MADWIEPDKPLPSFRKDLKLYKGPDDPDGSPTYNLYDPTLAKYYRITWGEAVLLRNAKPGMTLAQLHQAITEKSTLQIDQDAIKHFYYQAAYLNFLVIPQKTERLISEAKKRRHGLFTWLVFNYLYIRIPLFNPDKFLERTLYLFKPLISKTAFCLYFVITLMGLIGLSRQWAAYTHTFTYFFNFQGFVIYVVSITFVRIIHEFSHAYIAKYFGIRVPTMGIVLMVLWPGLFTDVTDGWKLKNRYQRVAISLAGVAAEMVIAGLATFAWMMTEPGLLRSILFVISAVTWISSIMVNLNPAMRFDGYYLICDLWGIDNLQPRAFAITRWKLHEIFLGTDVPPPEEFSEKRVRGLVIYTLYTWTYRLVLYTAIAVIVYYKFTKALGIFLFLLEIVVFLLWPIKWEIDELMKLREHIHWNPRSIATLSVLGLICLWFVLPLPHTKSFPAITVPAEQQILYVPISSQIKEMAAHREMDVKAHQVLVRLDSRELDDNIADLKTDVALLNQTIKLDNFLISDPTYNPTFLPETLNLLAYKEAKLKALEEQKQLMTLKADFEGWLYDWDNDLRVGQYVEQNQVLGKIAKAHGLKVVAYLPEEYLEYASVGQEAWFRPITAMEYYQGVIKKIDPSRVSVLKHPVLASTYKGLIPVVQTGIDVSQARSFEAPKPVVVGTYYRLDIYLTGEHPQLLFENTGYVVIRGKSESYLFQFLHYVNRLILRQSNF